MTKRFQATLLAYLALTLCTTTANAHFPWIKIDPADGKQGTALFYFEHAPRMIAEGSGEFNDKAYAEVHHHSTLVMNLKHPPR